MVRIGANSGNLRRNLDSSEMSDGTFTGIRKPTEPVIDVESEWIVRPLRQACLFTWSCLFVWCASC